MDTNPRAARIQRTTGETRIRMALNLDGEGRSSIKTGIGFLDHMLHLFAKHGILDLDVDASGDLQVDDHHTVEDVGICLGETLLEALGDKNGIRRYGHASIPMEEALAEVSLDLGGRAFLVYQADYPSSKTGTFDIALIEEFMLAFARHGRLNLHIRIPYGRNAHHMAEAAFKATAVALSQAVCRHPRRQGVPSTKGSL